MVQVHITFLLIFLVFADYFKVSAETSSPTNEELYEEVLLLNEILFFDKQNDLHQALNLDDSDEFIKHINQIYASLKIEFASINFFKESALQEKEAFYYFWKRILFSVFDPYDILRRNNSSYLIETNKKSRKNYFAKKSISHRIIKLRYLATKGLFTIHSNASRALQEKQIYLWEQFLENIIKDIKENQLDSFHLFIDIAKESLVHQIETDLDPENISGKILEKTGQKYYATLFEELAKQGSIDEMEDLARQCLNYPWTSLAYNVQEIAFSGKYSSELLSKITSQMNDIEKDIAHIHKSLFFADLENDDIMWQFFNDFLSEYNFSKEMQSKFQEVKKAALFKFSDEEWNLISEYIIWGIARDLIFKYDFNTQLHILIDQNDPIASDKAKEFISFINAQNETLRQRVFLRGFEIVVEGSTLLDENNLIKPHSKNIILKSLEKHKYLLFNYFSFLGTYKVWFKFSQQSNIFHQLVKDWRTLSENKRDIQSNEHNELISILDLLLNSEDFSNEQVIKSLIEKNAHAQTPLLLAAESGAFEIYHKIKNFLISRTRYNRVDHEMVIGLSDVLLENLKNLKRLIDNKEIITQQIKKLKNKKNIISLELYSEDSPLFVHSIIAELVKLIKKSIQSYKNRSNQEKNILFALQNQSCRVIDFINNDLVFSSLHQATAPIQSSYLEPFLEVILQEYVEAFSTGYSDEKSLYKELFSDCLGSITSDQRWGIKKFLREFTVLNTPYSKSNVFSIE